MTYIIFLKVRKFGECRVIPFLRYLAKTFRGAILPPPSQNRVNPVAHKGRRGLFGPHHQTGRQNSTPVHLKSPKFLTPFYTFWTHCGDISVKLICQGGCCSHLSNKRSLKIRDMNFLFLFKIAKICRRVKFGVRRTISGH